MTILQELGDSGTTRRKPGQLQFWQAPRRRLGGYHRSDEYIIEYIMYII